MMTRHNAIWYFTVFFLFILVASMTVIGKEIIVSPESFTIELVGGETVQQEITVTWTGSKKVLCTIETDIEPDGEGITVTYSKPSPFILEPGISQVTMTIKAALDIMPDIYVITTNFSCGGAVWSVNLNFNEENGGTDSVVFGEALDANDGEPPDIYDRPKLPAPMFPYIRAWFDDNLPSPYDKLDKDYREYPDVYKVWNLSVQWVPSDYVTSTSTIISWNISEIDDSEYTSVILYDDGGNPLKDMLTQNSYSFTCPAMTPQNFTIICDSGGTPSPPPSPGPGPGPVNTPPVADASAGEIYTGNVDEEITFDGTLSYDPDGYIVSWFWDFGDGGTGAGKTTTHSYSNPGTYNVILTVTDDNGDTGTYETTVLIMQANRPPESPIIDGVILGNKTVEYTYTAVSIDPDNDTIRYFFDWGDGTNRTSGFLESRLIYDTSHNWTTSGVYTVVVYAEDINGGVSGTTEMTVFIDVQFIDDVIQGYLLDTNDDGIYDIFHNNATGNETTVELQDNGNYLIDSDGDALWDYEYNLETSMLDTYPLEEEEEAIILWLIALIVMVVISVIIFVYFVHLKKKEKDKGQKKKKAKSKKEK